MTETLLTFGLITDLHYASASYGDRDCPGALARFYVTLDNYAKAGIHLVFNLGDAVDSAPSLQQEINLVDEVRDACASFPGQVQHVIGNHDVQMLSKSEFLRLMDCQPEPYYSFYAGTVHCIVLDGNCHEDGSDFCRGNFQWDDAWISAEQLTWLANDLAAHAGCPTLVFCHECLDDELYEGAPDPHVVGNAPEVRHILKEASTVKGVFCGHYHHGRRRSLDGIPYITMPAMCIEQQRTSLVVMLLDDGLLKVEYLLQH